MKNAAIPKNPSSYWDDRFFTPSRCCPLRKVGRSEGSGRNSSKPWAAVLQGYGRTRWSPRNRHVLGWLQGTPCSLSGGAEQRSKSLFCPGVFSRPSLSAWTSEILFKQWKCHWNQGKMVTWAGLVTLLLLQTGLLARLSLSLPSDIARGPATPPTCSASRSAGQRGYSQDPPELFLWKHDF